MCPQKRLVAARLFPRTPTITPRKTDVTPSYDGDKSTLTLCQRATRVSLTFRLIRKGDCQCEFPDQCDSQQPSVPDLKDVVSNEKAQELENKYVNQVYEVIADHFSNTRYKPWPKVASFLKDIPPGCVVLDVGCGNGKNLNLTSGCFEMGCDASYNLVQLCSKRNVEAVVADCLALPFRSESIDFVICIAVIHHMSTEARRLKAIEEIMRVLTPKGKALIYVWAFEQGVSKYIKPQSEMTSENISQKEADSIKVCDSACLPVHKNRTGFRQQDILVPWTKVSNDSPDTQKVHRYYHVFKQGELESLILKCGGKIVSSYHDEGNWCTVIEK
ncbi:Alkylated DNA repair protein alkB 8 [Araneus ventricosus]|uniref:Alkylated DNA repair protein alkB 8 n=1 Tax=Araneus ventricosus TaxID=182803 RepID=A0A4Y2J4R7_ARAVE|nr:Alkylated DNA repair protein alkB 8 [Araneus ventricosus]